MTYILRRKGKTKVSYRVQVRRRAFAITFKSFPARTEMKKWARAKENKLDRGGYSNYCKVIKLTLGKFLT